MNLPEHLGGHANYTNTDEGVLAAIMARYPVRTFLDIGCGTGDQVRLARDKGLWAMGIDGDFTLSWPDISVFVHDYTTGPANLETPQIDLGWCVEVLEHIEEKYLDNLRPTVQRCRRLWITHALPRQVGWHHVNCQPPEYWHRVFKNWGYRVNNRETLRLRRKSTMEGPYSRRTGMLMEKV